MEDLSLLRTAIRAINDRPRMFLAKLSLRELDAFLSGFCYGLDVGRPLDDSFHGSELQLFREWLVTRLSGDRNGSQLDLIMSDAGGDDEAAFSRFFALWDEFLRTADSRPPLARRHDDR
jgi:hypothetical protein